MITGSINLGELIFGIFALFSFVCIIMFMILGIKLINNQHNE
jgi:hypothetical protein